MRPLLISILTFFSFSCLGQNGQVRIFKKTEYINGNFYRQLFDTITTNNKTLDVYFFNKNFYLPYYLPTTFIDKQHRNQNISIWRDPKAKKDYKQNWENTYTYDSLGHVTRYTYSGCFICSNMPYNYTVTYNSKEQVEQLINTIGTKDSFKFYYNAQGDIIKFEKYSSNMLEEEITLLNTKYDNKFQ